MYTRILVPLDGSPTSRARLDEAIHLARLTRGRLILLYAIDDLSFSMSLQASVAFTGDWVDELRKSGQDLLKRCRATVESAGMQADVVLSDDYRTPVDERIVSEAHRCRAELIVIGTHGRRGIKRLMLGSTAEGVVRQADLPLLLVRAAPETVTDEATSDATQIRAAAPVHA